MADLRLLESVVVAMVESRIREADVADGRRVPFGCDEHLSDLERRLTEMESWRDRHRRGSSARADYSRVVNRLRSELKAARRARSAADAEGDTFADGEL